MSEFSWDQILPNEFTTMCAELLVAKGFGDVRITDGPGDRGRDILCTAKFEHPGLSHRDYQIIVQCSHTPRGLRRDKVLRDIAKAQEHDFDLWWLMTSATVSRGHHDWIRRILRRHVLSLTDYVDRPLLESWLKEHPQIWIKYFQTDDAMLSLRKSVMSMMEMRQYEAAKAVLEEKHAAAHPNKEFLLACCNSMLAEENIVERDRLLDAALQHLRESKRLGYVEYCKDTLARSPLRVHFDIHRDTELRLLRKMRWDDFDAVYPLSPWGGGGGGGSGCFPAFARVTLATGGSVHIEAVQRGNEVLTINPVGRTRVSHVYRTNVSSKIFVTVNSQVTMSADQPMLTCRGWLRASSVVEGDLCATERGPVLVTNLTVAHQSGAIYHLSLEDSHVYFVEGYVVHNKEVPYPA